MAAMLCAALCGTAFLAGCTAESGESSQNSTQASGSSAAESSVQSTAELKSEDTDASFDEAGSVKIELGTSPSITGSGARADGSTVTIFSAGTYLLSGSLSGNVVVDAGEEDVVRLVMNNAEITSSAPGAISENKCKKLIIVLPEGTSSSVSDGGSYSSDEDSDSANSAIYAEDDLTILGSGSLTVNGNAHNGITSKDDLLITGGKINLTSANHGFTGKENLTVSGGEISVTSGGDGMRSTFSDEAETDKGHILIAEGSITIKSEKDGIQSEKDLVVTGGKVSITAGASGGESEDSRKGLKSGYSLSISGGEINIETPDDGLHSNDQVTISGGSVNISSGDDGVHADSSLTVKDGTVTVSKSYEGFEAETVSISGGTVDITSSDDGINCAGGDDSSGFGGMDDGGMQFGGRGGAPVDVSATAALTISGGNVYVNAQGDGLDSNGSLDISGGLVVVNGTTQGGNGVIDRGGTMTVTGGMLVAAGTSDMLEMPDSTSTQNTLVVLFSEKQLAGSLVYVTDNNDKVLAAMIPEKEYGCFILNSSDLKSGETYKVYTGGNIIGQLDHGYYSECEAKDGNLYTSFTLSEGVTYVNASGVTSYTGGMGGGMGGPGGGMGGPGGAPETNSGSGNQPSFDGQNRPTPPEFSGENGERPTPPDFGNDGGNPPQPPTNGTPQQTENSSI